MKNFMFYPSYDYDSNLNFNLISIQFEIFKFRYLIIPYADNDLKLQIYLNFREEFIYFFGSHG